jgi:hypothetical protein
MLDESTTTTWCRWESRAKKTSQKTKPNEKKAFEKIFLSHSTVLLTRATHAQRKTPR